MAIKEKIIVAGKYFFLAGVALLIVRNNSYPFWIKRSSDILFFLSALIALYVILRFKEGYKNFLGNKNVLTGLSLICLGLVLASLGGYFSEGLGFTKEGILTIGRFAEVFAILFLVSFFQTFDGNFYKKAAFAQLSTLVYLPTLILPNADFVIAMYRFKLFENWPSNVGYYLIVSLTCIAVLTLEKIKPLRKTFFAYLAIAVGLSAVLLWTQSRAAWLGLVISLFLLILIWSGGNLKKIISGGFFAFLILLLAFSVLNPLIKTMVSVKIFPQNVSTPPTENVEVPGLKPVSGILSEPYRLELWGIYTEKLLNSPLGFGVNYQPVNVGFGKQGPHNTVLEFMVLAGPIGFAGFVWLLFAALKNVFLKMKRFVIQERLWVAYLFASLVGLFVASIFDNMSAFRLMWLILGLAAFV
ncbi:MAG: O-antigen ligase family protein [Candidatus Liptonbacteria bacterium]|nr:O-antigen ligase family protein [Candidatus Liptonbacteria bacterium]